MTPTIMPASPVDAARWQHTRQRRRLLEDLWEEDITTRLGERLTAGRVTNLGRPIMSLNLFQAAVSQLAVQYDSPPTVTNPALSDPATADVWALVQADSHIWEMAQSNAESTIGLRENLVKILRGADGPRLTMVAPDTVTIETAVGDPDKIVILQEAGVYMIGEKPEPCWTTWDISDPLMPTRKITTADGQDVSTVADPNWEGWVDFYEDGSPYIPYVRYRAKWTPKTWDAWSWSILVEAAIDTAILWTCWSKWVLDASWSQRYVIDLMLQGLTVTGSGAGATASVEADPTSILCFQTRGEKSGTASSFAPPGNPKELADSIMTFQGSVLSNIGIHPADLEATSQPSSGVAIQLKRSSQRRIAKKYLPQFRAGDQELLKKLSATYNSMAVEGSPALPEEGWAIEYHLPESSADEVMAELAQDLKMIAEGLASKVDVYQKLHPDLTREEALTRLLEIRAENEQLAGGGTVPANGE